MTEKTGFDRLDHVNEQTQRWHETVDALGLVEATDEEEKQESDAEELHSTRTIFTEVQGIMVQLFNAYGNDSEETFLGLWEDNWYRLMEIFDPARLVG